MSSSALLALIVFPLLGVVLTQTTNSPPSPRHETSKWVENTEHLREGPTETTARSIKHLTATWVKSTEHPSKPSTHSSWWLANARKHIPSELHGSTTKGHLTEEPQTTSKGNLSEEVHTTQKGNPPEVSEKHQFLTTEKGNTSLNPGISACLCEQAVVEKLREFEEKIVQLTNIIDKKLPNEWLIEVKAVSYDPNSEEFEEGHIIVNGTEEITCNNKIDAKGSDGRPGLIVCVLDTCKGKVQGCSYFSTSDDKNPRVGETLDLLLEIVPRGMTVIGTSCGYGCTGMLDSTKLRLKVMGVDLDAVKENYKFSFIAEGRTPYKGIAEVEKPSDHAMITTFKISGASCTDLEYEKVNG